MENLLAEIKKIKAEMRGAACFSEEFNPPFCANGLTHQEAVMFAQQNGLTLTDWQAGKSCSQVKCK